MEVISPRTTFPHHQAVELFRLRKLILEHTQRIRLLLSRCPSIRASTTWRSSSNDDILSRCSWLTYADRPGTQYVPSIVPNICCLLIQGSAAYDAQFISSWMLSRNIQHFNMSCHALPSQVFQAVASLLDIKIPCWLAVAQPGKVRVFIDLSPNGN